MSRFQLDPKSIAERAQTDGADADIPSLASSLWRGVIGFTIVSVAGFVPWAKPACTPPVLSCSLD